MAEIKVSELPVAQLDSLNSSDHVFILDDGKSRILPFPVLLEYLNKNLTTQKGDQGVKGKDGTNGTNGVNGKDGVNGKSAYEIAQQLGFTGTSSEWISQLKGTTGDKGKDGTNGWTPIFNLESSNGKVYLKIVDWVNGSGDKPQTGYVSTTGVTTDVSKAVNLKGDKGDQGLKGTEFNSLTINDDGYFVLTSNGGSTITSNKPVVINGSVYSIVTDDVYGINSSLTIPRDEETAMSNSGKTVKSNVTETMFTAPNTIPCKQSLYDLVINFSLVKYADITFTLKDSDNNVIHSYFGSYTSGSSMTRFTFFSEKTQDLSLHVKSSVNNGIYAIKYTIVKV